MSVVSLENVVVNFDNFVAVQNVNLQVEAGEVLGILGANGAGKSTTMKTVAGVLKPTQGEIIVDGLSTKQAKDSERVKALTGYCPDVGGLIVGATPREHIQLLLNLHAREYDYEVGLRGIRALGLIEALDKPAGGFSHGMARKLSVLLAALGSDKVLVLDEPFDGVDPEGAESIKEIIANAKASGLAVLVSTHLQSLLVDVSDRIVVMKRGQVIAQHEAGYFRGDVGVARYRQILGA